MGAWGEQEGGGGESTLFCWAGTGRHFQEWGGTDGWRPSLLGLWGDEEGQPHPCDCAQQLTGARHSARVATEMIYSNPSSQRMSRALLPPSTDEETEAQRG